MLISQSNLEDNEISIQGDLLFVRLAGEQNPDLALRTLAAFKAAVAKMKRHDKKVFVLVDLRGLNLSDVNTSSRLAIKEAFGEPFDNLAAVGSHHLVELSMYLMRAGGAQDKTRYFTSENKARKWLESVRVPKKQDRGNILIIAADIVGAIGLMGLLGWWIDNSFMTRIIDDLRPINPLGAIGLMLVWISMMSVWIGHKHVALVTASATIMLGIVALTPLDIDYLLFSDKVRAAGAHATLADSAALCFIAVGISVLAIHLQTHLARIARGVLACIIVGLALFNQFGLLYAQDFMYNFSADFVMALPLSIGVSICGITFLGVLHIGRSGNLFARITKLGWAIIAVVLLLQVVIYASWRQTISSNEADSRYAFELRSESLKREITTQVQGYIDALYGFRGLFAASDQINEAEFSTYYNALDLVHKYPGLRALSLINRVEEKDVGAYITTQRRDTSVKPGGNPAFTIQQKSAQNVHYVLTYLANNATSTALGTDFADVPVRLWAYQHAEATGQPAASETITFAANATTGVPAANGFFITMPLKGATTNNSPGQYLGFVSAVFNYDDFFKNVLASSSLLNDIDIEITDTDTGTPLFVSDDVKRETALTYKALLPVADRTWDIRINTYAGFGASDTQDTLPRTILVTGQIVCGMLIVIFIILSRSRQRALRLADSITADLQYERNQAIATQQEDDAILSSIGDAVFAIDTDRRITLFNPMIEKLSGYSSKDAMGKVYTDILQFEFETGKTNNSFIADALDGKMAFMQNHTVLVRKDGTRTPVADSAAPIQDASGAIIGAIVVFRDVSEQQALDRAKTEFVSLASHQLRTPLSAINWYAEMLLNGDAGELTANQRQFLQEIFDGNHRMVELVNALLDVSRLNLGKLSNEPQPNDIAELITNLQKEMAVTIQSKKLVVKNNIAPKLPSIIADPKLMRIIIQNLTSNALKYTAVKGTITTTVRQATPADLHTAAITSKKPHIFISVADTGYGIPKAQQNKIFSKLFRADNVRALDVEGTGLGLYIVKEVIEKLEGHIWFTSTESIGTTFYVVLPVTTKATKATKTDE